MTQAYVGNTSQETATTFSTTCSSTHEKLAKITVFLVSPSSPFFVAGVAAVVLVVVVVLVVLVVVSS